MRLLWTGVQYSLVCAPSVSYTHWLLVLLHFTLRIVWILLANRRRQREKSKKKFSTFSLRKTCTFLDLEKNTLNQGLCYLVQLSMFMIPSFVKSTVLTVCILVWSLSLQSFTKTYILFFFFYQIYEQFILFLTNTDNWSRFSYWIHPLINATCLRFFWFIYVFQNFSPSFNKNPTSLLSITTCSD